tara:strand:+ start:12200 stop:13222 length:1023 start_codon:yes stop_codon:yes gene_type:complete
MRVLVTGTAGFIGFHLCLRLIKEGFNVIGFDNINDYYDKDLKEARLNELYIAKKKYKADFKFIKGSLETFDLLEKIFIEYRPNCVINLAAQAGVRYSLENPFAYIESNIVGFEYLIELSKRNEVENFLYASSSSVYGGNLKLPFKEDDQTDHPVSLYAATKRSNELIAHTYSNLYNLPSTGLRFFTVYGPWGRPDMALFKFTKAIFEDKPINVFNNGEMIRDFTYINDVVESIRRLIDKPAIASKDFDQDSPKSSISWAPHRIFNIGNSKPTQLMKYISVIEKCLNKKARINFMPMQMGDVKATYADTSSLESWIKYKPNTPIEEGVKNFVDWYLDFYKS